MSFLLSQQFSKGRVVACGGWGCRPQPPWPPFLEAVIGGKPEPRGFELITASVLCTAAVIIGFCIVGLLGLVVGLLGDDPGLQHWDGGPPGGPWSPICCHVMRMGCFFLCVSACLTIRSSRIKPLPQTSQAKGFSPVCRHICRRRSVLWLNCLGHTSHLYGLSPACLARCSWKRQGQDSH